MQNNAKNYLYGDRYSIKVKYTFEKNKLQNILENLDTLEDAKMDLPLFYSGKSGDPITGAGLWSSPENHTVSSSDLKDILDNINQTEKIKQISKEKVSESKNISKLNQDNFFAKIDSAKNPDDVKRLIEEIVEDSTKVASSAVDDYRKDDKDNGKKKLAKSKLDDSDEVLKVFDSILKESKDPNKGPNKSIVVFSTPIDNSGEKTNSKNHVNMMKPDEKAMIDQVLTEKIGSIDGVAGATAADKDVAKEAAKAEADQAKKAIEEATTKGAVATAQTAGETAIKAIADPTPEANKVATGEDKETAKTVIDQVLTEKIGSIDEVVGATAADKDAAKEAAKAEADQAKAAIEEATTKGAR